MEETKIDKLRKELVEIRKERERIVFEKGMAAEENKDLRENSAYDYWFEKEMLVTTRINHIISMINEISGKNLVRKPQIKQKARKPKEKMELERPKWL